MSADRVDLTIDRLVVEGLDLAPEEGTELGRAVERELRRLLASGHVPRQRHGNFVEAKPTALGEPADLEALARTLAERIVAQAGVTP